MRSSPPVSRCSRHTRIAGGRRNGAFLQSGTQRVQFPHRSVGFLATRASWRPSSRSVTSSGNPGSIPGGGPCGPSSRPDKGVAPTPDAAPTVSRSPSLHQRWSSSWSVPSPHGLEVWVRIPGAESPPWCNLVARYHHSGGFPTTVRVPVAQSGQSTGLRSRVSQVRILPGTFAARTWRVAHRSRQLRLR